MEDPSSSSSGSFASSSGSLVDEENLVKGFAFEVLRMYLLETFGHPRMSEFLEQLPRRTRDIFEDPDINEWYSETEMRRIVHLVYDDFAERNDERFMEIMRGVAAAGINRFYRMILGLASGRFVLRNIPSFWKRVRKGHATLRTEQLPDGRVLIHYENFRYCRDPIYRLVSLANCQAAAFAATKKLATAKVVRHSGTTMTLSFEIDE